LNRLPSKAFDAVIAFISGPLAENPRRVVKPLRHEFEGMYSARVGPYRIRYEVADVVRIVAVIRIAHRADAHRSAVCRLVATVTPPIEIERTINLGGVHMGEVPTFDFDVVVLGSGASALAAAVAAHGYGAASVGVFEKADVVGGTSAMSGGMVWIPCNHHMEANGLSDSRADALRYLDSLSHDRIIPELAEAYVDTGPEMIRWFEEHTPVTFEIVAGGTLGAGMVFGFAAGRHAALKESHHVDA
jgi:mRNA-degrading endonuclease RelE of RelBE toxin-antitoxin system